MDEFDIIAEYLMPLAQAEKGALALSDDAALVAPAIGKEFVVSKDAISENVHFLPDTNPVDIARKLIRVNLSDMAAMGAMPKYYLIAAMHSDTVNEAWVKQFCMALAEEQSEYGISLIGGDTVRHQGPIALSLTMLGEVDKGKALTRSGAKHGDLVYVSGTIGDAVFGLKLLQGELTFDDKELRQHVISRYTLPQPRIGLGQELVGVATACIDISDGLLADLGHICEVSGVGAHINTSLIPFSEGMGQVIENKELFLSAVTGGDDYELLFTAPETQQEKIENIADSLGLSLAQIGHISEGKDIILIDEYDNIVTYTQKGYIHS